MLTQQENDELTQVGPGTPMGDVLRHYWYPVAFVRELEEFPVKEVRLLGENWAVFRTPSGEYGIVDERCPHRGASLTYGIVEDAGLRCGYHGWLFNTSGECVEILAEPDSSPKFRAGCGVRAGSAQALGGMVWVHVGDGPAPELPRYEAYVMNGYRDIGHSMLPCNWLQIMENAVDPYHVEALHGNYFEFIARRQGTPMPESFVANKHEKVAFDPFDHGIIKRRLLEGQSEDSDDWKIGHPLVFPYKMWVGGNGVYQMQIRVPVDDTHTWALFYTVHAPDGLEFGDDLPVVDYEYQWIDDHGRHIVDYIEGQDVMAWVTQGPVADRVNERITKSDVGILACRRMFKEAIGAVRRGEDPVAVVREPHDVIKLPLERSKFGRGAGFAIDWINDGSMRYSPIAEEMKQLHIDAAAARADLGGS
ncbi:MAG: Rieske 2Fe-2S domain-containing protein [Acidimicrobiaceae bacterium]|nr:Rieske 2Fe-2S domain-containing protein [Acidimicrobiaceae bacterium]